MKKTLFNLVIAMLWPRFQHSLISISLSLVLILVLTTSYVSAQEGLPTGIKVGQEIPEVLWKAPLVSISPSGEQTIYLAEFKGKAIIIDFWASWCNPCLANMPHLDSLSRVGETSFQVLMANTGGRIDSLKNLREFVKGYLKDKKDFNSQLVLYSPVLNAYFPHHVVPHYIWIGPDGRVKAITDHRQINPANIKTFVSGGNLDLPLKTR
nr:TlpA disulfide reductase family protein [uncultured Pedobacter sp.]